MKLKNKKTGEIIEKYPDRFVINSGEQIRQYDSLAELNEEWEDVPEEPKEHWYINEFGTPTKADFVGRETLYDKCRKDFGNYFETREEAEKAVERLRAWKRLKDKGFRFTGYDSGHNANKELCGQAYFKAGNFWFDIKSDLELLFGGEE